MFRAIIFSLYPATLLRILIISDYNNELAFLEAKECGVICGGGEDSLGSI